MSDQRRDRGELIVIHLLIACSFAMGCGLAFGDGRLNWSIALISALPPFAVAWYEAKRETILAPFALFAGSYGGYNGVLLLRLSFLDRSEFPYPIDATQSAIIRSAELTALGSAGIVLIWLLWPRSSKPVSLALSPHQTRRLFSLGLLLMCLGLAFYWLQLLPLGGFRAAMNMPRVERLQLMKTTFSFPYTPCICISLALLFLSRGTSRIRQVIGWTLLAALAMLFGMQGDRSMLMRMITTAAVIIGASRPQLFQLRLRTALYAGALVAALIVFGQLRSIFSTLTVISTSSALNYAEQYKPLEMFQPENTELSGPYLSILDAVSRNRELMSGASYLRSLPTFVPRFFYPGQKPQDLGNELADSVSGGDLFITGRGYSPIAEAYRNFGAVGVPVVIAAWGALFLWLGRLKYSGWVGLILTATLLMESVLVQRNDFRSIYIDIVFGTTTWLITVWALNFRLFARPTPISDV